MKNIKLQQDNDWYNAVSLITEPISIIENDFMPSVPVETIPITNLGTLKPMMVEMAEHNGQPIQSISTAYTKDIMDQNIYSSSYNTVVGKSMYENTVSKSIDIKKDVRMTTDQTDSKPVHLYFREEYQNIPTEIIELLDKQSHKVIICNSWAELAKNIKLKPHSICFHSKALELSSVVEVVNMVNTLAKLVELKEPIRFSVAINKDTPFKLLKEIQKTEILGIVPESSVYGIEETMKALNALWNEIPYWPKHIIEQLPGGKKNKELSKTNEIKLTPRQEQVLNLIQERGASNKVIANILKISESTVKLHVACIFKKYNVRNRTQLALFSKQ